MARSTRQRAARPAEQATSVNRWTLMVFAAVVAAGFVGAFSFPAMSQAQTVDLPAALVGVAGALAALSFVAGRVRAPRSRLALAWILFVAWALIAALASGRSLAAFVGEPTNLLGWWAIASVAVVAAACASYAAETRSLLTRFAPWLLLAETALVAWGVSRASGTGEIVWDLAARGSVPNSSALGQLMLLLLPWTLAVSAEKPGARASLWRVAMAATTLAVLAVSRSRVALAMAVLWAVWWALSQAKFAPKVRRRVVVALATIAVAGLAIVATGELRLGAGGELGLRPEFYRVAWAATLAEPLTGYGPDGFVAGGASVSTPEFVAASSTPLVFMRGATDPHNLLAWTAVSSGFVGLALLLWALGESALVAARRVRQRDSGAAEGAWALAGALVVMLTAPAAVAVLPLLGLVAGATFGLREAERAPATPARAGAAATAALLGVSGLLLCTNTLSRYGVERADAQISPPLAASAQQRADAWMLDPHLYYLASLHWGWAQQAGQAPQPGLSLAAIQRAAALDRRDPVVALELARALRSAGAEAAGVDAAFTEALRRWPASPVARLEFAEYLARTGRGALALEQLAVAGRIAPQDAAYAAEIARVRGLLEQVR